MVNAYFYRVVDKDLTEVSQGVSIHGCVQFLAGILESGSRASEPSFSGARMLTLINQYFPALIQYLTLEHEFLGMTIPSSFFRTWTQLNYGVFARSITFYKVSKESTQTDL